MKLSIDLKCDPVAGFNCVKIYLHGSIVDRVKRKLAWSIRIQHGKATAGERDQLISRSNLELQGYVFAELLTKDVTDGFVECDFERCICFLRTVDNQSVALDTWLQSLNCRLNQQLGFLEGGRIDLIIEFNSPRIVRFASAIVTAFIFCNVERAERGEVKLLSGVSCT